MNETERKKIEESNKKWANRPPNKPKNTHPWNVQLFKHRKKKRPK